jgi:hypothetical protein
LVAARFVERIPSPEPVLGNKEKEPAKRRGAKAAKVIDNFFLVFGIPIHGLIYQTYKLQRHDSQF